MTEAPFVLFHAQGSRSGRTKMMLDLLELPYELRPIELRSGDQKTASYLSVNPYGTVPTLLHETRTILESAAQLMYLAELVPDRPMAPEPGSPERATYYELFVLAPSVMETEVVNAWHHPEDPASADAIARALALYESRLVGPFFLGASMTALDVFLHWSLRFFDEAQLEWAPRVAAYCERMNDRLDWTGY